MTPELRAACEDALHVLTTDGDLLRGERAVLFVYEVLGYGALAAPFHVPPLSWAAAASYQLVAQHRRWFARFLFRP